MNTSTTRTIQPPAPESMPLEEMSEKGNLERRSAFPGMERHRRLFAKIEQIVRRYSIAPLATNEEGEYTADFAQVREFLEKEIKELGNLDALIPLLRILRENEWNLNEGDKRIGAYRLVSPTIKELNDYYLGPNQTDDYVDEIHQKIEQILGEHNAKVLKSHFKGGIFIIDVARIEHDEPNGHSNIDVLELKLGEIQRVAKEVLLSHLKKRRQHLEKKQVQKSMERLRLSLGESGEPNEQDVEERVRTLSKEIHKLEENIEEIQEMCSMIESGEKSIDIAIGLDKLKAGPQNSYLAIRNAECAANIATLQKLEPDILNGNGKKNGVPFVYMREYSHKELFKHLIKAQHNLGKIVNPESLDVYDEWKQFFMMDENGYVRMNPEMINTYRHIDKYRKSDAYMCMTEEEKQAFEDKLKFFDRYYKAMNIVDFLKNFQTERMEPYLSDIYRIVGILNASEKALKEEKPDEHKIRTLLEHTSKALEVSLKNDSPVENRVRTTRAAIKAMMEPGMKVIIFGDNIGFGALNQSAFERCAIDLIGMLNINNEEWAAMVAEDGTINKAQLDALLEKKLEALHEQPEFTTKMMAFDDTGTAYLRGIEEKMFRIYGGNPVIDADGGDETRAVYTEGNVPGLGRKVKDVSRRLLKFSVDNNIRIAARADTFQLPPITTEQIQKEQRQAILELIETMEEAEAAHTVIKADNIRGDHRIVMLRGSM